ncbi:unnamed protein product [Callosobruchus maculatus]|uniref:Trehalase n=1 Tax=Callosobruchus maculatus TaxID=64391 RepID=A0A653C6U4_CALMS|nr:unnamed protein product [Callosobruchus maculatus]
MKCIITVILFGYCHSYDLYQFESCESQVYCQGKLLDFIQRFRSYNDSKTFVDMIQITSEAKIIENFDQLLQATSGSPSPYDLGNFMSKYFVSEGDLDNWLPPDFNANADFIRSINDVSIRDFAQAMINIWPTLGRKVRNIVIQYPNRHSSIYVPNGFIVPGGRFRETYYWDSYWIIKGLLISGMTETARGMIENFLYLIANYGYVPNGSRVYYLGRSQPPLLALMMGLYMDFTNDIHWLQRYTDVLETELLWWMNNRSILVVKNGRKYVLSHYSVESGTPRPESYYEDYNTCSLYMSGDDQENCYSNLKSAAESGWDFSTRWIFNQNGDFNISNVQPKRIVPVDLNSYLCRAFKELARFYKLLNKPERSKIWLDVSYMWQDAIEQVLYNDEDGIWYDYDIFMGASRPAFYPSNFAPLWTESFRPIMRDSYGLRAARYLLSQGITQFPGGIPTSLIRSGQQWDFPNCFPPLQETVILGLQKTRNVEASEVATLLARRVIDSWMKGYSINQVMYEKYNAERPGEFGEGGEYQVQSGFGWTNGVALSLINEFFTTDKFEDK